MFRGCALLISSIFTISLLPVSSPAAPFYTPPCVNERDSTDDALYALERCLLKQSHPPFKSDKETEAASICSREMKEFLDLRDAYRRCLKPFAQSESQSQSKVEVTPPAPKS